MDTPKPSPAQDTATETEAAGAAPYRVMKFGGSSLGSPERLQQVIEIIATERKQGPLAVVVSAMGETTDWLIEAVDAAVTGELDRANSVIDRVADLATRNALLVMAQISRDLPTPSGAPPEITPMVREFLAPLRQLLLGLSLLRERSPQTLDLVLSFGERLSSRIVAALISARGTSALPVDGRDWVSTDASFGMARVDFEATRQQVLELARSWGEAVPVHTGFIGRTVDGRTTTLGRNGSDYTATLLARSIAASEVIICTDVNGVMTADPNIVDEAYPVPQLSYLEALELANYGARMFHPRTMLPLIESGIPMRIRNTMAPEQPGTQILARPERRDDRPTCVTSLENLALVGVRWRKLSRQAQVGERVLNALARADVPVWMATQSAHGQAMAVAIPNADLARAREVLGVEFRREFEQRELEPLEISEDVTLLSLVAERLGQQGEDTAGRFFGALGQVGVSVLAIAQGEGSRSISCIIEAGNTATAVRTVHTAFNFAHQEVNLMVLGKGVVGSQLLEQIDSQRDMLRAAHDLDLRIVGLADSNHILFEEQGIHLADWEAALEQAADDEDAPQRLVEALDRLRRMPVPILVDCTAANEMEALYAFAFARGIHVVAANKKPLTISSARRHDLLQAARRHHRHYQYETTVGASLPVIDTLKNLVRTGDQVLLIEGAFSGTLGYLCNEIMAGTPLSEAVRTARELGYTEPRPQDDLSGLDVARKALILARELGMKLELDDITIEPLIPQQLLEHDQLEDFFEALQGYDDELHQQIEAMKADHKTLRYLAVLKPSDDGEAIEARVGPVPVPTEHPATRLRGAEAFVAFTTERFHEYPLIVQGAGAGGAVTAAGVLADVLRISQSLRGR